MRKKNILGRTNLIDKQGNIHKIIKQLAKQRKQIIYGARSIEAQAGLFSRPTKDYDIFDKNPKKTANQLQRLLDKNAGFDYYYSAPAKHEGTWKVKNKGNDGKKNTEDDESIADYTNPNKHPDYKNGKVPYVTINGLRFRILKEELRRKRVATQDPAEKYRWEKDKDDIRRIKGHLKVKKIIGRI